MITKPFVGVLSVMCAFAASAGASAATRDCVRLSGGWARLPPVAAMPMTAGYGTLHNACDRPVTVVGVSSPAFAEASLHETTVSDGVSRMQHLHHLPLAAGARVELKPGGMHVMLMQGRAALKEGQVLPLVLELEGGDQAKLSLQVRKAAP